MNLRDVVELTVRRDEEVARACHASPPLAGNSLRKLVKPGQRAERVHEARTS